MIDKRQIDIDFLKYKWDKYKRLQRKLCDATYGNMFIDDNGEFCILEPSAPRDIKWELTCLEVDIARLIKEIRLESTEN